MLLFKTHQCCSQLAHYKISYAHQLMVNFLVAPLLYLQPSIFFQKWQLYLITSSQVPNSSRFYSSSSNLLFLSPLLFQLPMWSRLLFIKLWNHAFLMISNSEEHFESYSFCSIWTHMTRMVNHTILNPYVLF